MISCSENYIIDYRRRYIRIKISMIYTVSPIADENFENILPMVNLCINIAVTSLYIDS